MIDIPGRKALEERLRRRKGYLAALRDTNTAIPERLDLTELLLDVVARAAELLGSEHGYLYPYEPTEHRLVVRYGVGIVAYYLGDSIARKEGLSGRVWQTARPVVVDDYHDRSGSAPNLAAPRWRAMVGARLRSGAEALGVFGIAHREGVPLR